MYVDFDPDDRRKKSARISENRREKLSTGSRKRSEIQILCNVKEKNSVD
jgi:hypothetical protein